MNIDRHSTVGTTATSPSTTAERAECGSSTRSLPTFVSHVAEINDLTPNVREIVLEGGLDDFVSLGGDQFVYLMVARPGGREVPPDHTMAAQLSTDPETGPIAAYYTVRSWEPREHRLTLWMVRHGHPGSVGSWAERSAIGERVALWGPRAGFGVRSGTGSRLFITDETGFGAVAALLDVLPAGVPATVLAETVDADHVVDLPLRPGVTVTWQYRGDDEAGTSQRLFEAVRSLDLIDNKARGLFAFGAGESAQMTRIRRYLRRQIGMQTGAVSMTGYWRRHQTC